MKFVIIDNFTIVASLVLLLLGIVTPMLHPFFRFKKRNSYYGDGALVDSANLPPLSIVLTPFDDTSSLQDNLPAFLRQNYPAGYQVVVVIEDGDHEAEEVIAQTISEHQAENTTSYSQLYVTYIPKSSRYLSRKKLAITLGIKAVKTEWVVLTEVTCHPATEKWLESMASHCTDDINMVKGYSKYHEVSPAFERYDHINSAYYLMREDIRNIAYRSESYNLIIRKSDFMTQDGFLGNLHLMRGEYDFIVNKFAQKGKTALAIDSDSWLIDDQPLRKSRKDHHIFYMETRRHLARCTMHRLLFVLDQIALHSYILLFIAAIILQVIKTNLVFGIAMLVSIITWHTLRFIILRRGLRNFDEQMSIFGANYYDISMIWRNFGYWLHHRMANKQDFITHKL